MDGTTIRKRAKPRRAGTGRSLNSRTTKRQSGEPPFCYEVEIDLGRTDWIVARSSIAGRFRHFATERQTFSGPEHEFGTKLGFRLLDADRNITFHEDRARLYADVMAPGAWVECEFVIPDVLRRIASKASLYVDLVQEHEYWFSERQDYQGTWFDLSPGPGLTHSAEPQVVPALEHEPGDDLAAFLGRFGVSLSPTLENASIVLFVLRGEPLSLPLKNINAASVELEPGAPSETVACVRELEDDLDCIVAANILQRLPDYRSFLSAAFDKLRVGGKLIISVPHLYLYERKLTLPSRYDAHTLRFYSASSLMAEVEEAIDPFTFRLRLLLDDDRGYSEAFGLEQRPLGKSDLVLVIEKVSCPAWRGSLAEGDVPVYIPSRLTRHPKPDSASDSSIRVISPSRNPIRSFVLLKLDHRGDFLMAAHAFKTLRLAYLDTHIVLICGRWNRDEAARIGCFDEIITFDFFPEDASAHSATADYGELSLRFYNLLKDRHFDVAIDFRLLEDTRDLLKSINSQHKAGFDPYYQYEWLTIRLNLPMPTRDGRAEIITFLAADFHATLGDHLGYEISFPSELQIDDGRALIWGPYKNLGAGNYDLDILIESFESDFKLRYDVSSDKGVRMVGAGVINVSRGRNPRIQMISTYHLNDFEFRLYPLSPQPLPPFKFLGLRCSRAGVYVGVHQREAMALLAHLVQLRLTDSYKSETLP